MGLLNISNVLLWVVVIVQSIMIYALLRQVGVLFERVAPAGALSMNKKLKVGQKAPEMSIKTIKNQLVTISGDMLIKPQLLFFLSPECPVCKTLLPALKSSAKDESDWVDVILATDDESMDHDSFINFYKLNHFPYVISEILGKAYGVSKLPYAVLIDEKGKIVSMGIINSREHLDSLFEAKERNVASIQDYMKEQSKSDQFIEVK